MLRQTRSLATYGGTYGFLAATADNPSPSAQDNSENSRIKWCNRVTAMVHLIMVIVISILVFAVNKKMPVFYLKQDAVQIIPSTMYAPVYNPDSTNSSICDLALPGTFQIGNDLTLSLTTYPRNIHFPIYLHTLIIVFFGLSFFFQGVLVESYGWVYKNHFYDDLFSDDHPLMINRFRFIEYSASATVMLIAISILAGINDVETLSYSAILCATCMLVGLAAEQIFAIGEKIPEAPTQRCCTRCAWGLHWLGWLCIGVPYIGIAYRYERWYLPVGGCDAEYITTSAPPAFVRVIIYLQLALFASFGFVQMYHFRNPRERKYPEYAYITLSAVAKILLAWLVAANLFM